MGILSRARPAARPVAPTAYEDIECEVARARLSRVIRLKVYKGNGAEVAVVILYFSMLTDQSLYPVIDIPPACLEGNFMIPPDLQ